MRSGSFLPVILFLPLLLPVFWTSPLYGDEGYIPFFPDALEPDGIGFRGPASSKIQHCWADLECRGDLTNFPESMPLGKTFSGGSTYIRSSPFTLEYRKEYFFKKLFYSQTFAEFGQTVTSGAVRHRTTQGTNVHTTINSSSDSFLANFLKPNERSKIPQDVYFFARGTWPYFDLLTKSKFILFGKGLGIDLWIFEASWDLS